MTADGVAGKWEKRAKIAADILFGVILALCAIVLSGWFLNNSSMKHLVVAPNAIPSSTAVSLTAIMLTALLCGKRGKWARIVVAALLGLAAAVSLAEAMLGAEWGLAFPIGPQYEDVSGLTFPGPMAPNIALEVILLAVALAVPRLEFKGRAIGQTCAFIVLLASVSALIGHALGVDFMCTFVGCIKIPAASSAMFTIGSAALLLAQPEVGGMRTICADNIAGATARKLSLALLAVPIALALRAFAVTTGVIDSNFGWFLFGAAMLALMWKTIGFSAQNLAQVDDEKAAVEKKLQDSSAAFDKLARAASGVNLVSKLKKVCLTCAKTFPPEAENCPEDDSLLVAVADDNLEGRIFAERYMVTDYIGRGGMCAVYKAKHIYTEKIFAVKVLLRHLASDPNSIKRFQREAKSASMLSHPNLLQVSDFGVTVEGQAFLIMDYVNGDSLDDLLQAHPSGLPVRDVIEMCTQICDGLAHAHEHNVIHRDLKPSNIMIQDRDGKRVMQVVDFGLAKIMGDNTPKITETSQVVGSPIYMGPEQYGDAELGPHLDVYSLGCMMHELFTGLPPFIGNTIGEVVQKHLTQPPPLLPDDMGIPEELRSCVHRSLDKDPSKRPSVTEILECLRATQIALT